MFFIYLELNDKGAKVCGSSTKVLTYNSSIKPNRQEIEAFIASEFMPELVNNITEVREDFSWVEPGMVLRYITPSENGHADTQILVEVVSVSLELRWPEFTIVDRSNDPFSHQTIRINLAGYKIGTRVNKPYVQRACEAEIIRYNELKNIKNSYDEVFSLLAYHPDYEYDNDDVPAVPRYLDADTILEIRDMLRKKKADFYGE